MNKEMTSQNFLPKKTINHKRLLLLYTVGGFFYLRFLYSYTILLLLLPLQAAVAIIAFLLGSTNDLIYRSH
jgi:hypothetical protein